MSKKGIIAILLIICVLLTGIIIPMDTVHAESDDDPSGDAPWYAKPIIWILDVILGVFGGIHEPAEHVYYQSCSKGDPCPDRKYGLYEYDKFDSVIRRGYVLFSVLVMLFVTISIVKTGIFMGFTPISSTMKVETSDLLVKCLLASILLGHFFTVVGTMFDFNNMIVKITYLDIKSPIDLSSYDPTVSTGRPGITKEIEMNMIAKDQTGFSKAIINIAIKGISIWWEIFYLQRFMMISILLILAPLWISMLFYPMLQSITWTAMKELWTQIIAQGLHATLFWIFYSLFDTNQMTWFQMTVVIALFIPISESVRFIFGATSGTGNKLAMLGTIAGAGAFLHMGNAIKDLGNVGSALKGGSGQSRDGLGGSSSVSSNGYQRDYATYGGSSRSVAAAQSTQGSSKLASRMRVAGGIGSAVGSAYLRTGGSFAGMGLGGFAQYGAAELGAKTGSSIGYRAGAGSVAVGQGTASWAKNTREHMNPASSAMYKHRTQDSVNGSLYSESFDTGQGNNQTSDSGSYRQSSSNSKTVPRNANNSVPNSSNSNTVPTGVSFPKAMYRGLKGGIGAHQDPSIKRQTAESVYGAIGEVVGGRGGFEIGRNYAQWRYNGAPVTPSHFSHGDRVFTVESNDTSFLATQNENGTFQRIGNFSAGNRALSNGEVVVRAFEANKTNGQPFSFQPVMQQSPTNPNMMEPAPATKWDSEGNQIIHQGNTINPHQFLDQAKHNTNHVDLKRRSAYTPPVFRKDISGF
ncbi:hypothetical protein [Paenibacillus thiaminolyticus]|uniref:Uncharacterized protein n=1 Tax=Paenibacillus thiaminolyticus TaxID=49283 RepID=A0A3A3GEX1_PANTH|nr:hypothetical protein [Paenibacillus thiaminolyticus]RJG21322.1 hypothetical protein DQX05_21710 [Paenibacillus thiaminolyticus]